MRSTLQGVQVGATKVLVGRRERLAELRRRRGSTDTRFRQLGHPDSQIAAGTKLMAKRCTEESEGRAPTRRVA